MKAGKLRFYIDIEYPVNSQHEETGENIVVWEKLASEWADIDALSAREFVQSQSLQSKVMARIVIRFRPDVNATMRINHNGRLYYIEGVLADKDSGREYLTLPVSEGIEK